MKDAHRSGQLEEHFFFLFIFIIVIFSIVFPWVRGIGGGAMRRSIRILQVTLLVLCLIKFYDLLYHSYKWFL